MVCAGHLHLWSTLNKMNQESLDPHSQLKGCVLWGGVLPESRFCRPEHCSHALVTILKEVLISIDGNMEAVPGACCGPGGLDNRGGLRIGGKCNCDV